MLLLAGCPGLAWTGPHGLPPLIRVSGNVDWPSNLGRAREQGRIPTTILLETWTGHGLGEGTLSADGTTYHVTARQDQIREGWHTIRLSHPTSGQLYEGMAWLTPSLQRQVVTLDATRTVLTSWVRARYGEAPPMPEVLANDGPEALPISTRVREWETRLAAWVEQDRPPFPPLPGPAPIFDRTLKQPSSR
ncbi:MAG: hypothetical protein VKP72_07940 [bacterium]|nr:hypothetical protein [bacterium]